MKPSISVIDAASVLVACATPAEVSTTRARTRRPPRREPGGGGEAIELVCVGRHVGHGAQRRQRAASSRDRRRGSYGNWNRTGTQWVEYEWTQPISTNKIDVYWWADGQGVGLPEGVPAEVLGRRQVRRGQQCRRARRRGQRFNTTTFDEVTTPKLRLEIDSDGTLSTGILEWRCTTPASRRSFRRRWRPASTASSCSAARPISTAAIKTLGGEADDSTTVTWSKESGPGEVTFADAAAAETTATFSELGDYVLEAHGQGRRPVRFVDAERESRCAAASQTARRRLHQALQDRQPAVEPSGQGADRQLDSPLHRADRNAEPAHGRAASTTSSTPPTSWPASRTSRHRGYVFSNAWVHQTVESMCIALMVDPQGDEEIIAAQEKMKGTLEDWIPKILAAQEPDGYLQTAFTLDERKRALVAAVPSRS